MVDRQVKVLAPDSGDHGALAAATDTVESVWRELGLTSRPTVTVRAARRWGVEVDGRSVPLSPRRRAAALAAGQTATDRLAHAVDSALRADVAQLVATEPGIDPAVAAAAELGFAPSQLVPLDEPVPNDSGVDVQDWYAARSSADQRLRPIIELHPSTLRRLTCGGAQFEASGRPGSGRMVDNVYLDFGVRVPPIGLAAGEQPADVVRFRFGRCRTAAHRVLGEDERIVKAAAGYFDAGTAESWVDPLTGAEWAIVAASVAEGSDLAVIDPAAAVMRCLQAELKTRLALIWPFGAAGESDWWDESTTRLPAERRTLVYAAFRRLLAAQVSLHIAMRLAEGVANALAHDQPSVTGMVDELRRTLGRGVLGSVATTTFPAIVALDERQADAAVRAGDAALLLSAAPLLEEQLGQVVVVAPQRLRADAARLLRPLADGVLVVGDAEGVQAAP